VLNFRVVISRATALCALHFHAEKFAGTRRVARRDTRVSIRSAGKPCIRNYCLWLLLLNFSPVIMYACKQTTMRARWHILLDIQRSHITQRKLRRCIESNTVQRRKLVAGLGHIRHPVLSYSPVISLPK